MQVAQRIEKIMQEKGITKYRLAKELGVHQTTVKNWLDGKTEPKYEMLERIAAVLSIEAWRLFYDENPIDITMISNRIKYFRDEKGWTLQELSEQSGIALADLEQLENGERRITNNEVDKILKAFDVPKDVFFRNADVLGIQENADRFGKVMGLYSAQTRSAQEKLLEYFHKLNDVGQSEAVKRVGELTQIPEYKLPDDESEGSDE